MKTVITKSEVDTRSLGKRLGRVMCKGDIVALCGELGSGKTVLTKGIAEGLDVKGAGYVNSPSFIILKEYKGRLPLYHFDIYRLDEASDFLTVDYAGFFYGDGVTVIEWADRIERLLPEEFLKIEMTVIGECERKIDIRPQGKRYKKMIGRL